jgi:hypothetical protein
MTHFAFAGFNAGGLSDNPRRRSLAWGSHVQFHTEAFFPQLYLTSFFGTGLPCPNSNSSHSSPHILRASHDTFWQGAPLSKFRVHSSNTLPRSLRFRKCVLRFMDFIANIFHLLLSAADGSLENLVDVLLLLTRFS